MLNIEKILHSEKKKEKADDQYQEINNESLNVQLPYGRTFIIPSN